MATRVERVFQEAIKLSKRDRGDLAARPIDSLDPGQDSNIEAAWAKEIERRLHEIDQGKVNR